MFYCNLRYRNLSRRDTESDVLLFQGRKHTLVMKGLGYIYLNNVIYK